MTLSITEYVGIAEKYRQSAPVNVVQLAREIGLAVYLTSDWPETASGMIRKNRKKGGRSGYAVTVNDKHCKARQRFTIAHEIGHFVLHPDLIGDRIGDDWLYRSRLPSIREAEANRFAANLLMPNDLIEKVAADGADTIPDLARVFEVTRSTVSARLGIPFEIREPDEPAGGASEAAQRRPGSA